MVSPKSFLCFHLSSVSFLLLGHPAPQNRWSGSNAHIHKLDKGDTNECLGLGEVFLLLLFVCFTGFEFGGFLFVSISLFFFL